MERFKCKLCLKTFGNGRALGGHMRSHMPNLSSKRKEYDDAYEDDDEEEEEEEERPSQLSEETESGSLLPSSSSSSDDDGHVGECYGSREDQKKKSIRVADPDPEFGFAVVDHHGSVVVVPQDGESETESSRVNPTRRRSKRTRKLGGLDSHRRHELSNVKKLKPSQIGCRAESGTEPEPLSSVSDTTTEEDLAVCLMMLSRDKWKMKMKTRELEEDDHDDDHGFEENDTEESEGYRSSKNKTRGKFKCETCNKVFKSYQALGGHRASHKKNRNHRPEQPQRRKTVHENENGASEKKIHECPICFRVFSSGQALGGHKRSHGVGSLPDNHVLRIDKGEVSAKQRLIDLNLPAPTDDDETSQVEVSVVFDE